MKQLNKLEELQKEAFNFEFIKSYPILNRLKGIRLTEIRLIELVLSYQHNDKDFYMGYHNIAEILDIKYQTVCDMVCRLDKKGLITSINTNNYNGIKGGSSSRLSVNEDVIINLIKDNIQIETPKEQSQPIEEVTPETKETTTEVIKTTPEVTKEPESYQDVLDMQKKKESQDNDYSNIVVDLNNGKKVFVLNSCVDYWDCKQDAIGLMKKYKNELSQVTFDMTIKDKHKEWLSTKDIEIFK